MAIEGSVSYNIRAKGFTEDNCRRLKFLKVGCGAGYNFVWLAEQSVRISGYPLRGFVALPQASDGYRLREKYRCFNHQCASDITCCKNTLTV